MLRRPRAQVKLWLLLAARAQLGWWTGHGLFFALASEVGGVSPLWTPQPGNRVSRFVFVSCVTRRACEAVREVAGYRALAPKKCAAAAAAHPAVATVLPRRCHGHVATLPWQRCHGNGGHGGHGGHVVTLPWQRCRGNVAMATVATVATVASANGGNGGNGGHVATLPGQRCRGNVAVATLPWQRCHGNVATVHVAGARCRGNAVATPWQRRGKTVAKPWQRRANWRSGGATAAAAHFLGARAQYPATSRTASHARHEHETRNTISRLGGP